MEMAKLFYKIIKTMSLGYLPVVTSNDRRMDLRKIRTRYVGTGECLNFEVSTRTEPKFP